MSAANATQQVIPKAFPKILHRYVGRPRVFEFLKPYEKYYVVAYLNSVYNAAPLFKWSLSIVPLYGIFSGSVPVEKVDFNSSAALSITGLVWFVYALLIQPQNSGSRSLALVNMCLASVNGYNCYRSWAYKRVKALDS
ncbi:putative mitochondrial pyruvate carrier protein [Trypanosoma cruzi]|uniref:Mitochondrial pyruvate carrier n=1 Tax=Trypanosoma cruzi TaxID=5693 RepID=A0A2V2V3R9_TRYCR|nr:Mitochondrial pyruvate carrier 2 [Trypanosoma cruzi]PBJ76808.1 hypothetical protein BCY84_07778 [Trypanosoma cruzi cruzi]PWU90182.1 Mitochondrial pyruvate carrier 2 [Trypanosoma cruzi]RNF19651.1 putative mitochondrial pyruvate carrier protein [Trypanosoma cruzi]